MRVVIIGGSGHVGTYLVPRLVAAGHAVIAISRGRREPYQPHAAWQSVQQIVADRDAEEAAGTFGARVGLSYLRSIRRGYRSQPAAPFALWR